MAQNDLSKTRTQSINIFCGQTDVLSGLPGSSVDQGGGSSKRTPAVGALAAAGNPATHCPVIAARISAATPINRVVLFGHAYSGLRLCSFKGFAHDALV